MILLFSYLLALVIVPLALLWLCAESLLGALVSHPFIPIIITLGVAGFWIGYRLQQRRERQLSE